MANSKTVQMVSHEHPTQTAVDEPTYKLLLEQASELDLFIDLSRGHDRIYGKLVSQELQERTLTPNEAKLLRELMRRPGRRVAIQELQRAGGNNSAKAADKALRRLKRALSGGIEASSGQWFERVKTDNDAPLQDIEYRFTPPPGGRWILCVNVDDSTASQAESEAVPGQVLRGTILEFRDPFHVLGKSGDEYLEVIGGLVNPGETAVTIASCALQLGTDAYAEISREPIAGILLPGSQPEVRLTALRLQPRDATRFRCMWRKTVVSKVPLNPGKGMLMIELATGAVQKRDFDL